MSDPKQMDSDPVSTRAAIATVFFVGFFLLAIGLLCLAWAVWGLPGIGCVMSGIGAVLLFLAVGSAKKRAG